MFFAIPFPAIDPVALSVPLGFATLDIRWYSIAYIAGIMLGWWYISYLNKKDEFFSEKALDAMVGWAVFGIVLGGRFGYVLFYNLPFYIQNPSQILAVWEGGMSFHGGLLGVIISYYIFSKKYKIPFLSVVDRLACVAPIGLFFGRISNFINGELYGRTTSVAWGMVFPNSDGNPRHPSQLYEAVIEGLVVFIVMLCLVSYRNKKSGLLSGTFLILYSLSRTIIECFREPDEQLGFLFNVLTMGQLLSLPMFIMGLYLIFRRVDSNEFN